MNKKYIVGGLIFWAGMSGYMGLRILESYTEDAVFAALSAVPAQAQQIRYSFLSNTLTLKGVEYEIPDDRIMHKGTIENVEVKGFNRKCMFVKPDMPAYDPDALPVVAESITATGIVDNVHVAHTKSEQRIEKVQISGWHQRLGMLLDQRSQHGGEASFFEELFRCRLDGLEISNVTSVISEPGRSPMHLGVAGISLPGGMRAPRGTEKVAPVNLAVSGMFFGSIECSGGLQKLELKDVLLPEPAVLADILRLNRELSEPDGEERFDDADEEFIAGAYALLQKNYEEKLPLARMTAQGGTFVAQNIAESEKPFASVSLNSFDYALSLSADGALRNTSSLAGLKVQLPGSFAAKIISRYAPDGLVLNAKSESVTSDAEASARARYEFEGLGVLEGDMDILGDMRALQTIMLDGEPSGSLDELMQSVRLKSMNAVYRDSGLLPMLVEIMARWKFTTPEELLQQTDGMLKFFEQSPERPMKEFCRAVSEQLAVPGEFRMTVDPEKPVNAAELFDLASINPDALPVSFSSKPGSRALKDYLPESGK